MRRDELMRVLLLAACMAVPASLALAGPLPLPPPAGLAPLYVGEVATRARVANAQNTSNTQFMSRSQHVMRDTVSALTVLFPTWYVNSNTNTAEEISSGSNETIHASIEYPAGIESPLNCNGTTAATVITDGSTIACTTTATPPPYGAIFWIREWANMPAGIIFTLANGNVYTTDTMTYGTSVADQTASGTVANTSSGNVANFPVAIIGQTRKQSACLVGDSRVQGIYDTRNSATGDGGELERFVGPQMGYINISVGGDTAYRSAAVYAKRKPLLAYCSIMINELGINDLIGSQTVAATETARKQIDAMFSGRVIGVTLAPATTSSDKFATAGNQTTLGSESGREQFNADVRAGLTGETDLFDIDAAIDPNGTHLWPTNGIANYSTPDGLHENTTAAKIELYSSVWNQGSLR